MLYVCHMDIKAQQNKFIKALDHYQADIGTIRTSRASASILDEIEVEYYDAKYKIKELASISVPEPRTLLIQPWDKGAFGPIQSAIQSSQLNLNPVSDNLGIRLIMPALTEERRLEFIKLLKQKTETARIAIRQIRGEIWDQVQAEEKAGTMRENEKFKAKDDLQKIVDEFNVKVEELENKKEQELMN